MVKVTVYIATYNYAQYIEKAINSVINQTMSDWELIVINDGSTDNTKKILEKFKSHPQIAIINQSNKGLNVTNNIALRLSQGKYIVRLDSDDYFDENALLILSNILDTKHDIDLVYPDYYEVDPAGSILKLVRRDKIGEEVELLDLPAHGACTILRKSCLLQIGGYIEDFSCQDGYEMWLRFIRKYKPYNVNIPLFYYRQHPASITKKKNKLLKTRRRIKRNFVENELNNHIPKVLVIIPVGGKSVYHYGEPFQKVAGKPLLWYTLSEAVKSKNIDRIIVTSNDDKVLNYVEDFESIIAIKRPPDLSPSSAKMYKIINFVLDYMEVENNYFPEAVCTLYINTPLRTAKHIDKAIDTMAIFKGMDTVLSVEEELSFCYQHKKYGLKPINKSRNIRIERESLYKENGAIYLNKTDVFKTKSIVGKTVGHITMLPEESIRIKSAFDLWMTESIISEWSNE